MSAAAPGPADPERNSPEVDAAFEAVPSEVVAEVEACAEPFDAAELDLAANWAT